MENFTKYALKSEAELDELLQGLDNLFVIACNKCFKEFDTVTDPDLDTFLQMAQSRGKTITGSATFDFLCNKARTRNRLAGLIPEDTENIMVISCGLGVQTVAVLVDLPVFAVCNSLHYAGHHGMALTKKACEACAQCYLNITGGICPVVDCAKSLLNGQCGGAKNGKCELSPDRDCAWQKIQERLEKQGRLEELKAQPVQLRDYAKVNYKVISEFVRSIREKRLDGWRGGIHPVEDKGATEAKTLIPFPEPKTLVFPMSMHMGAPAIPVVAVGDRVKVGQVIGLQDGFISAPVHASVSGTVVAIEERPHATRGTCLSVVIESDGKNDLHESVKPNKPLEELSPEEIVEIVKNAGIVGMGGAGFPTYVKLMPGKPIDTVLLNGCECEPMLTADHRVMVEYADEIVLGLRAVMKAVDAPRGIIVIEENKPDAIEVLRAKTAELPGIEVMDVTAQYPQGGEKMLIKRALDRDVPSRGLPADVGACVSNVSTVKAIADAILTGMPLIERATTVTGKYIPNPGNFMVKIGTSAAALVEYCGGVTAPDALVKAGGPMMGFTQENLDTPIMKVSNGIITMDDIRHETQECIKCGRCVDVCPLSKKPLYYAKLAGDPAALKELDILDCMECRSCEYICSSKIPLVDIIRAGKIAVRGMK